MKLKKKNSIIRFSAAEYLTFVAGSANSDVNAIYADETIWLSQKMISLLYDVEVNTVNYHLKKIFSDSELQEDSVIRNFRITESDGKNYNTMHDWELRLNKFSEATDREILQDPGKVTVEIGKAHAESEFEKYRIMQDRLFESDFDRVIKHIDEVKKDGSE